MQSLCEDISKLQSTANVARRDKTRSEGISNEMTVNLNMLRTFVKNGIGGNVNGSLTVGIKRNRMWNGNMKIPKKMMDPFKFTKSNCHRVVFRISGGVGDHVLLLSFLREKGTTKGDKVTSNRTMSNRIVGLIKSQKIVKVREESTQRRIP